MKNLDNSYWKKRAEAIDKKIFENAEKYTQNLKSAYEEAEENLQLEINDFYKKFAVNNQISLAEAKKVLTEKELKEFKTSLKRYQYLVQNNDNDIFSTMIENISIKHRITRLQALQSKIELILKQIEEKQNEQTREALLEAITESYYENTYSIEKATEIHTDFASLDTNAVNKILQYDWSGVVFSERIWKNQNKLKDSLDEVLRKNFIQRK